MKDKETEKRPRSVDGWMDGWMDEWKDSNLTNWVGLKDY
jgi:hypothetical protein